MKYRLGGSRKVRKLDAYTVELCDVLVKEKKKSASIPASSIVSDTTAFTLFGVSTGDQTGRKRKQAPSPFFVSYN